MLVRVLLSKPKESKTIISPLLLHGTYVPFYNGRGKGVSKMYRCFVEWRARGLSKRIDVAAATLAVRQHVRYLHLYLRPVSSALSGSLSWPRRRLFQFFVNPIYKTCFFESSLLVIGRA